MARPGNALLSAVGVLVGALALSPDAWRMGDVALAMAAATLGTAGGNVLNDLADRDVDRHAHPHRPLVTGVVAPTLAAGFVLVAWLVALGAAALVSVVLMLFAAMLMGLLVAYEAALKRSGLAGNVVVALVAGALFPFGAVAVGGAASVLGLPLVLGAVAAVAHLGRELQKDAEDVAADAAVRDTWAVRHGKRAAAMLGGVSLLVAVVLAPLPHWFGWGDRYLVAVVPAVALFVVSAWRGLEDAAVGRAVAKVAMVWALAAFVVGALWS